MLQNQAGFCAKYEGTCTSLKGQYAPPCFSHYQHAHTAERNTYRVTSPTQHGYAGATHTRTTRTAHTHYASHITQRSTTTTYYNNEKIKYKYTLSLT